MRGINHFTPKLLLEKRASTIPLPCVFVSYSRRDKEEAVEAVNLVEDLGIDVYFDRNDVALQLADEEGNHSKVVECIENGLDHATTILGIITENTKESWWVPYEIGSATGRGRPHAHLITKEVESLPSYIQASTILPSLEALDKWLVDRFGCRRGKFEVLNERLIRTLESVRKSASFRSIPRERPMSDLTFY